MSRFLQLHGLIFYPPSNPNRDDTGRPKSAVVGGVPRLRISSQALKRAWRTSDLMINHRGRLTRSIPHRAEQALLAAGFDEKTAEKLAITFGRLFGKVESRKSANDALLTQQSIFLSSLELERLDLAIAKIAQTGSVRSNLNEVLQKNHMSPDVAMFGRMLTNDKDGSEQRDASGSEKLEKGKKSEKIERTIFNCEAATQVAHAFTVHKAIVEDDYFSACDDLNDRSEATGAGFIGEQGFGSGVFYLYTCVDLTLLRQNLGGDTAVAGAALGALVEAVATIGPGGKQASFANRTYAHYLLAERGDRQPRSLAAAFAKPVEGDLRDGSVGCLRKWRDDIDEAYKTVADARCEMQVPGAGTLAEVVAFCRDAGAQADA